MRNRLKFAKLKQDWVTISRRPTVIEELSALIKSLGDPLQFTSTSSKSGGDGKSDGKSSGKSSSLPAGKTSNAKGGGGGSNANPPSTTLEADKQTYLDCLLKLGEWKLAIIEPGKIVDPQTRTEVSIPLSISLHLSSILSISFTYFFVSLSLMTVLTLPFSITPSLY